MDYQFMYDVGVKDLNSSWKQKFYFYRQLKNKNIN